MYFLSVIEFITLGKKNIYRLQKLNVIEIIMFVGFFLTEIVKQHLMKQ